MSHASAQATPTRIPIARRRVEFDFDSIEGPYWFGENVLVTAYLAGLSGAFPPGEKEFVRSVLHYRDRVRDPALLEDIRGFAAQEGSHSNQHRRANEWLDRHGYAAKAVEAEFEEVNARFVERFSPEVHLALTVVVEHITAIFAEYALTHPETMERMPPPVREMLEWHAVEEIEHKAVAFDLFDRVVGDRNLLRAVGLFGTWLFLLNGVRHTRMTLENAPRQPTLQDRAEAIKVLLGKGGLLRSVGRRYLDFYRRDFHPWMHENGHLVAQWSERQEHRASA